MWWGLIIYTSFSPLLVVVVCSFFHSRENENQKRACSNVYPMGTMSHLN